MHLIVIAIFHLVLVTAIQYSIYMNLQTKLFTFSLLPLKYKHTCSEQKCAAGVDRCHPAPFMCYVYKTFPFRCQIDVY